MTSRLRAAQNGLVAIGGQGAKVALQFVSLVALSRLLAPADFGLVAIVLAIVGVGELLRDFGLSSAAIQTERLSQKQKSNLFWVNLLIGLLLFGLIGAIAWPLAALLGDARLGPIMIVIGTTFAVNSLQTQFQVELVRRGRILRLTVADLVGIVVGVAIGIFGAAAGFGYWAIVAQVVAQSLTTTIAKVVSSGWRPSRPDSAVSIRPFIKYAAPLATSQLLTYASSNVDSVALGASVGATQVGFYNRAFQIAAVPVSQLLAPLTNITLPILARSQNDLARMIELLRSITYTLGFPIIGLLAYVAANSSAVVHLLLGEGWEPSEQPLMLLSIASGFQFFSYVAYWAFLATGRTRALLLYNVITKSIIITVIVTVSVHGTVAVAGGYALALLLSWPLAWITLGWSTGMRVSRVLAAGLQVVVMGLLLFAVCKTTAVLGLPLGHLASASLSLAAALVAVGILCIVPAVRRGLLRGVLLVAGGLRRKAGAQ